MSAGLMTFTPEDAYLACARDAYRAFMVTRSALHLKTLKRDDADSFFIEQLAIQLGIRVERGEFELRPLTYIRLAVEEGRPL